MGWRRHWAVLFSWWSRPARYCEWESLPSNDNRIFLAPIGWYGLAGYVVPTGRSHKPHSECHNQFIGNQVWRTCYLTNGQVGWPPRMCDLTRLDYFLWGYVKSMVYSNKPATIDEIRMNIEREIAAVSADLCLKIIKNLGSASGLLQACPLGTMQKKTNFIMALSVLYRNKEFYWYPKQFLFYLK